jgi:hypothetical protein
VSNRDVALRLAPLKPFPCVFGKDPAPGFLWTKWPNNHRYGSDGKEVPYVDEIDIVWNYYRSRYGIDPAPAFSPGAVGLVGIDLDRKTGRADGVALFDALLNEHGELPPCPITVSPSGGYHPIFKQPLGRPPLGNREGWFAGKGVNVRGKSGYLLCPGATIIDPETGECFEYKSAPGCPDLLEAFLSDSIPVIPDWLVDLIEDGKEPDEDIPLGSPIGSVNVQPSTDAWNRARADAYIETPLQYYVSELAGMPAESGRNGLENRAVFYISGLIHCPRLARTSWTADEVFDLVWWAYRRHPSRKRNAPQRFRATFRSAWNSGIRKPARGPAPDVVSNVEIMLRGVEAA